MSISCKLCQTLSQSSVKSEDFIMKKESVEDNIQKCIDHAGIHFQQMRCISDKNVLVDDVFSQCFFCDNILENRRPVTRSRNQSTKSFIEQKKRKISLDRKVSVNKKKLVELKPICDQKDSNIKVENEEISMGDYRTSFEISATRKCDQNQLEDKR